jgi:gliding motility-associated-like protein
MRKITLMIIVSLLSFCTYGQLALEGFETSWTGTPGAPPGGWAVYNEIGNTTWVQSTLGNTQTPPFAGSYAAYLNRENVAPSAPIPSNWLITKQFNSPNNGQLHFYSRLTLPGDNGGTYKIKIAVVTNASDPVETLPWVDLVPTMGELDINPIQLEYVEKTINIPATYAGQQVRIAFIMQGDNMDRWLLDNVEVISQCSPPATLTASNITINSASLNWTSPPGVTTWEIELVGDTQTPTGTGVTYSGALPYQATNLTPATSYKYYVRSACTDGGKSIWIGPFYFVTPAIGSLCGNPIVIPGALPYSTANNTTNFGDYYEGIPGTGCNATGNYLAGNDVVYSYTAPSNGTINISLSNTGGAAGLFVYANCTAIGVNCLAGVTASATAAGVIPTFAVTAGTTYYIVVSTNGTPQITQYNLTLQQVYCAAPTGLTASGQTPNSANLSWTAGTATAWQVYVQNAGGGLPTGAGQNVTQNTNLPVSSTSTGVGFLAATAYEYYVRANCGDGTYSIWTGPFAFSTTQVPASIEYTENFDGPAPHGFSLNNGSQVNKWYVGGATYNSPTNSLYISNDNGITNAYTITTAAVVHAFRDIQMPVTVSQISVSFDVKAVGQSATDYIRVWLVPTSFVPTPGTQITAAASGGVQIGGNYHLTPDWTTQNTVVNASTFQNTTRRLIFEWRNDAFTGAQPAGAVDNINIKVVTCPAPSALTLGASTQTSATYTWTAPTGTPPAEYEYYYSQNAGAGPGASTTASGTVTATTATISPLTPSETYYMWVRSKCSASDKSFWIGPTLVVVPQIPAPLNYTQNFDSGPHGISLNNGTQTNKWVVGSATSLSPANSLYISNNGTANTYTNSVASVVQAYRDITIPSGAGEVSVTFDYKVNGDPGFDYLRVWMVPVTFVPTPGTQITAAAVGAGDRVQLGGNIQTPTPVWTNYSFDTPVATYQNQTRRLVFEWRNDGVIGADPPGAIDNINVSVVTCPKPSNLTAINITSTNATLDWTEPGASTIWEVVYMPATGAVPPTASTVGTTVTGNSEYTPPLGTFVYGTQYVYYVRSDCGAVDGKSKWAGPFAFALKPANDDCATPTTVLTNTDLNCTNFVNGSIMGATLSPETTTCIGTKDDDVWYTFVATNTSHNINFNNVTGSTTDLVHGVYSGTGCGALTLLYCSDPNNSVANNLVVGQTYYIRVWTWTATVGQTSAFQLCITTPPPPPANDVCSAATVVPVNPTLACDATVPGTIYSATASTGIVTTCTGTPDDDVWFKFVATNTTHRISILNITGSTTLLYHSVYTGTDCATFVQNYCSTANLSWANNLTVGQTYYIRIYSQTATAGQTSAFSVCVATPPPPPVNDECAGAITAPVNPTMICEDIVDGSVQSATASPEANTCSNTADDDDVWFEFTATATTHIVELKNITGSSTDVYHAVYVGDVCGTLTQLYCSDPNYSLATGLTVGQTYKIRVWTNTTTLNQTTAFQLCVSTPPPPPTNDECSTAIVVPVNQNSTCTLTATASVYAATASPQANTCGNVNDDDDVWFKFTATATTHLISLTNFIGSTTDLYHVLYSGTDCNALTQVYCSDANNSVATGLVIGNEYKVRVYSNATTAQTTQFDICIKIPNTPIIVNPNLYSVEQLVTEVLINSECALVSNVTSVSQSNFGGPSSIAYFDANGATFPFSYGVVLSTSDAVAAQGPYTGTNTAGGSAGWVGDTQLNNIIVANDPAQINGTQNATLLEFDFIPLTNKFTFDFLFASSEYGTFQCTFSDAFAFILTDSNGNSQNLAVLPNTNIPVSVTNIRDTQYNTGCGSQNVQYFGQYNLAEPMAAAINFQGQTKPLTAEADVVPNTSYHIKLVIADYSDTIYNSAVFLGGGTFDIGELDMGGNLTVDNGTALCETQSTTLDTGLVGDQYNYAWYKDGTLIANADQSTYDVTESGTYGVEVTIDNISCSYEGTVVIEFYTPVNELTGDPVNLVQCDATGFHSFDITPNLDALLSLPTDPANFTTTVHLTEADAQTGDNPIDPASYTAYTNVTEDLQTLWTRTVYSVTTCVGVKSFDLVVQDLTPQYTIDSDFSICDGTSDTIDVVITDTDPNPVTYVWTKDGAPLPDTTPSITVTEAGAYTVVLDRTGCSTSSTVNVVVTPIPVADAPADVAVCGQYILPALSANNSYFRLTDNLPISAGDIITTNTTVIVRAESGTNPNCTSENTFTVTINPVPEVASPGDQSVCDSYVLPALENSGNNYYTEPNGTGTLLNANDVISSSQTIYVYEATGSVPNCVAETSFVVTITTTPVADAPGDVNTCDSYTLPALSAGNAYYTGPGGTGTPLAVGEVITTPQLIYIYAQNGTCTDEHSFTVNITPTPAFNLGGPYVSCVASNITINVEGINFNAVAATYAWTLDGTPIPGGNSIVASGFGTYALTVTVNNCSHTESIEVTQNTDTFALLFIDGCEDSEYMLSVNDDNGSFNVDTVTYAWTGPNGFTSGAREFVVPAAGEYFVTVTTPDGCVAEDSFIVTDTSCEVQRGISPNGDGMNDSFDLTSLNVKKLSVFNRYGQEVYTKNNYKNEWFGQNESGKELPTGTYFYMIERMSGESTTGWIYINRQD